MSKKVLIISSSPHKGGNPDILFAEGAKAAGNEAEKVWVIPKHRLLHELLRLPEDGQVRTV
jgi:multimeric flavodoxin WrbA